VTRASGDRYEHPGQRIAREQHRCRRISSCSGGKAFDLLTAAEQLDEPMRVTGYPKIREHLAPALAGRLINQLRDIAVVVQNFPSVAVYADPFDSYLLAIAPAGAAMAARWSTANMAAHENPRRTKL
jgi:predicted nucleic acid-binding protein